MSTELEKLRREILQMHESDVQTRTRLAKTGKLFQGYNAEMEAVHLANARRLEEIINQHGWLGASKIGEDGAEAAWLIVQHAISLPDFQRKCLQILQAEEGEIPLWQIAYLADRIAFFENRPQKYGTQSDWNKDGKMQVWKLEDESKVNEYRAEVGLKPLEKLVWNSPEAAANAPRNFDERQVDAEDWAIKVGWRK